jgi:hypothetical protein
LPEEYLPESISNLNMTRSADLLVFRGDSLSQYTNQAGYIQRFNFVDLATTEYTRGDITIVVEIYRFASSEDAFGLYSHSRWGQWEHVVPLGVEGFYLPTETMFVKDKYLVQLTGFSDDEEPTGALNDLAAYLADELPGTSDMPENFAAFPQESMLCHYAMYFPSGFLGMEFLNHIYGCNCVIETDTVFLMLALDSAGPMVLQWSKLAEESGAVQPLPEGIPFDDEKGFLLVSERMGNVLIGVKNNRMAAMMGYDERHKKFFCDWLESFPERTI